MKIQITGDQKRRRSRRRARRGKKANQRKYEQTNRKTEIEKKRKKDERNEEKVRERTPLKWCRGNWERATKKRIRHRGKERKILHSRFHHTSHPTNQPSKKNIHTEKQEEKKRDRWKNVKCKKAARNTHYIYVYGGNEFNILAINDLLLRFF